MEEVVEEVESEEDKQVKLDFTIYDYDHSPGWKSITKGNTTEFFSELILPDFIARDARDERIIETAVIEEIDPDFLTVEDWSFYYEKLLDKIGKGEVMMEEESGNSSMSSEREEENRNGSEVDREVVEVESRMVEVVEREVVQETQEEVLARLRRQDKKRKWY